MMNLQSWIQSWLADRCAGSRLFRQKNFWTKCPDAFKVSQPFMFLLFARTGRHLLLLGIVPHGCLLPFSAQTNYYANNGTEYAIVGSLPGDQVFPDAAVTPAGGFVVWQDNITDGSGWGSVRAGWTARCPAPWARSV